VELCPLRRATAPAIFQQLSERIFYRHGGPREIISDNGRQFIARQTRQLLQTFGIRHRTALTYAPQCNPVERTNKTVKTMIAQYVGRNHRHWDQQIATLQFAYNTGMRQPVITVRPFARLAKAGEAGEARRETRFRG